MKLLIIVNVTVTVSSHLIQCSKRSNFEVWNSVCDGYVQSAWSSPTKHL